MTQPVIPVTQPYLLMGSGLPGLDIGDHEIQLEALLQE